MTTFEEKYELIEKQGEGAFAEVWSAWYRAHPAFEKKVAVKIMHEVEPEAAAKFMRSFLNEARLGAALQHPCVVSIFDFGVVDGKPYFCMEFIEGVTLRRWQTVMGGDQMPLSAAVHIGLQVARALEYAHNWRGPDGRVNAVVHRDLKPENIMIGWTGEVKLLDYGIARWTGKQGHTTTAGVPKGTPAYMSPEQITAPESVHTASDVFSLGTILLEAVTARTPFHGLTLPIVLRNVVEHHPTALLDEAADVEPGLSDLLETMLRKEPSMRPTSRDVRARLLELGALHPMVFDLGERVRSDLESRLGPDARELVGSGAGPAIRISQTGHDWASIALGEDGDTMPEIE